MMSLKNKMLGMAMLYASIGDSMFDKRANGVSEPCQKTCKQCGSKYQNRGKICSSCFDKNGGKLTPPTIT